MSVYTAAPIVRQPHALIGAPGKTDFVKIFIAQELNAREYRTVMRHEQMHVWARHNKRRPKDANHRLWTIAMEMEIARSIYDAEDIETIKAPRSRLKGGYLPDSLEKMDASITLAEDIYQWLLDNPDQVPEQTVCVICGCEDHGETKNDGEPMPAELLSAAKDALEKLEKLEAAQTAASVANHRIVTRPPSLTEEIDAALRVRMQRERSYRRPGRRQHAENCLMAGAVHTPRPPRVEIFVDRSGSFTPAKTAEAERKVSTILRRYHATVQSDVWYFGSDTLSARDIKGGGNTPYHLISGHLANSLPKIAIVITDDDPVVGVERINVGTKILCVPIGCAGTNLAKALGGVDVAISA